MVFHHKYDEMMAKMIFDPMNIIQYFTQSFWLDKM